MFGLVDQRRPPTNLERRTGLGPLRRVRRSAGLLDLRDHPPLGHQANGQGGDEPDPDSARTENRRLTVALVAVGSRGQRGQPAEARADGSPHRRRPTLVGNPDGIVVGLPSDRLGSSRGQHRQKLVGVGRFGVVACGPGDDAARGPGQLDLCEPHGCGGFRFDRRLRLLGLGRLSRADELRQHIVDALPLSLEIGDNQRTLVTFELAIGPIDRHRGVVEQAK